ncbi:MAG: hypothetical protein COA47_17880 [Robiginitomaculum sp.]|nr:MAG: hypothetical protein COA47_17880 [Robiginitomaculum sp.]
MPIETPTHWSEDEVDLIIADYFEMLKMELAGKPFIKSHHNAALCDHIRRSRGSIEFKHQNISAVLVRLGMPWIRGYRPLFNFQNALIEGVGRYLGTNPSEFTIQPNFEVGGMAERPTLFLDAPPSKIEISADDLPSLRRLASKFDPSLRDAKNRQLGKQGEELVYYGEKERLTNSGCKELAQKVRWVSQLDGDGAGYDILSFATNGDERLLEVKTTAGHQTTPFYLSENERLLSVERPGEFRLFRVYEFGTEPRAFQLKPPLEEAVTLSPTNYRASF